MKHPKKIVKDMISKPYAPEEMSPSSPLYEFRLQFPKHSRKGLMGRTKDYIEEEELEL